MRSEQQHDDHTWIVCEGEWWKISRRNGNRLLLTQPGPAPDFMPVAMPDGWEARYAEWAADAIDQGRERSVCDGKSCDMRLVFCDNGCCARVVCAECRRHRDVLANGEPAGVLVRDTSEPMSWLDVLRDVQSGTVH